MQTSLCAEAASCNLNEMENYKQQMLLEYMELPVTSLKKKSERPMQKIQAQISALGSQQQTGLLMRHCSLQSL